jgi:hypothetical protein
VHASCISIFILHFPADNLRAQSSAYRLANWIPKAVFSNDDKGGGKMDAAAESLIRKIFRAWNNYWSASDEFLSHQGLTSFSPLDPAQEHASAESPQILSIRISADYSQGQTELNVSFVEGGDFRDGF